MGVRTRVKLSVEVGPENSLDDCLFERDLEELLDTMEDSNSQTFELSGGEVARSISLGDVQDVRLIYIEADAEINVWFGGVAATAAAVLGVGGTYPTTFAGGETFIITVDGVAITVTFTVAAQLIADTVNEVNAAAALLGIAPIAFNVAGQLQIKSTTTGVLSTVLIGAGTGNATLGHTSTTLSTGTDPLPATSPITLLRMANPAGTSVSGLKAFLLASARASAVFLTNPDPTNAVRGRFCLVGDLVAT